MICCWWALTFRLSPEQTKVPLFGWRMFYKYSRLISSSELLMWFALSLHDQNKVNHNHNVLICVPYEKFHKIETANYSDFMFFSSLTAVNFFFLSNNKLNVSLDYSNEHKKICTLCRSFAALYLISPKNCTIHMPFLKKNHYYMMNTV